MNDKDKDQSQQPLLICQACLKHIRLDASLLAADFTALGLSKLTALSSHLQEVEAKPSRPLHTQSMMDLRLPSPLDDSLRRSADDASFRSRSLSLLRGRGKANRMAFVSKLSSLFDEAARVHQVDLPLCRDCHKKTETLLALRLDEMRRHTALYQQGLLHCPDLAAAADPLPSAEEAQLRDDLARLEDQLQDAVRLRVNWEQRQRQAQQLAEICARARNGLAAAAQGQEEQIYASCSNTELAARHLQRLARVAVLNDVFHIWYMGHLGTINGLRLGRLPSIPVDWMEINAALGLTVLLLVRLGRVLRHQFREWRPVAVGASSKMENLREKVSYELAGSSDGTLSRLFGSRKFDVALGGFLVCVEELVGLIQNLDPSFLFPYQIHKEKIGVVNNMLSIKYQFSDELQWSTALKYMLTTLKYIIAFVSKRKLETLDLSKRRI